MASGTALDVMDRLAADLPDGMQTEWTGISLEQRESGGQTVLIFGMGLVFVPLVIAGNAQADGSIGVGRELRAKRTKISPPRAWIDAGMRQVVVEI